MLRPWQLQLTIDRTSSLSVQGQIVHTVVEEIGRGRLRPGMALPGSRDLAAALAVNRKTVIQAYDELVAQGWLTSQGRRGTFVSEDIPAVPQADVAPRRDLADQAPQTSWGQPPDPPGMIAFRDGVPDTRLIPFDVIARAFRHALIATARSNRLSYGDPRGEPTLRQAIAAMLRMERGLDVGADGICVVRGSQMGIFLAARLCLAPGDNVVVEELCYPPARDTFRACGANILTVGLDRSGMKVDELEALCRRVPVKLVYATPHHQYPTSVMMAADRRMTLLLLAERYGFRVIEDDYDHEFHFSRRPVLPLASMDGAGSVIYVGSMSKVLAPGLRIGYLAASPAFIARCAAEIELIDRQGNALTELAVAELMESGELKRHARKMLKVYGERRAVLSELLTSRLSGTLSFAMPEGGLAFWARLADGIDPEEARIKAEAEGLRIIPGRTYSAADVSVAAFRLGFGDLDAEQIRKGVDRLANALAKVGKK